MASPHLQIGHITESQDNKETTANAAFDKLDNAMNGLLDLTVTGDVTLTSAQFTENQVFRLNGSSPGAFSLNVPAGTQRIFTIINSTGSTALVDQAGSQAQSLEDGRIGLFFADEDDIYLIAQGVTGSGSSGVTRITEGGDRTLSNSDFDGDVIILGTSGSLQTFTIESGLTSTEPLTIIQTGAGQILVDEGTGVSIIEPDGEIKSRKLGSAFQIIPIGSDTYHLVGDLTTP